MSRTEDRAGTRASRVRRGRIAWIVVVCIVSALVGAYFALAFATADLSNWGAWARDFAKSPGAAAFAALIAAAIAYRGISSQVAVARASLSHQQDATRSVAWWQMFEWASGRAVPTVENDVPLPDTVTISTLQRLSEEASSNPQKAACAGMIDMLTTRLRAEENADVPHKCPSGDGAQADAISALASYVASARGTTAASAAAEGVVYEHELMTSLASIRDTDLRIFRSPGSDFGADAVAEVSGRRVLVVVKMGSNAQRVRAMARDSLARLRSAIGDLDPVLYVTPYSAPLGSELEGQYRAMSVQWRDPSDTPALAEALKAASAL